MINKAILLGRIGRDPEIRHLPTGMQVAEFSVATDERVKRGDKWEKETTWHNVVAFEKTAESIARFTGKGLLIFVEGRIKDETWEAKDGSGKKHRTKIIANQVKFVEFKTADEQDQRGERPIDDEEIPF